MVRIEGKSIQKVFIRLTVEAAYTFSFLSFIGLDQMDTFKGKQRSIRKIVSCFDQSLMVSKREIKDLMTNAALLQIETHFSP